MSRPAEETSTASTTPPPATPSSAPAAASASDDTSLRASLGAMLHASRGFWLVNMVNFGDGIAYFGILTLLTRFLGTRVHLSDEASGLTVSAFTGLVTFFMFGGGFVSDRLGVRRALTWSLGVVGFGRLLLTVAPALSSGAAWAAWVGLMLMALGTGVMQPALYAGVKEYTDERTATIGFGLLYAIMNLGIVAESIVSPWVRTSDVFVDRGSLRIVGLGWGIDGVFWMCVVITALMLVVHMALFTRRVEETERIAPAADEDSKSLAERLRDIPFLDARFMFFIFILLPVRTLFAHQFLTMPDYVFRAFPPQVGERFEWISGINPLIIVVAVPIVTVATRKIRTIDMMIVGTAVTAFTTFLLAGGPSLSGLIWYTILFSLGEALWSSRFLEYVADLSPPGRVGAYMGLAGIPWFLAKFTTGLYSGAMLARFVPEHGRQASGEMWFIYGCIACISPLGLLLARRWILAGESPQGAHGA